MSINLSGGGGTNPFGASIDSSEITDGTIVAGDLNAALTADLVHISGTETITGAKTFSSAAKIASGTVSAPSLAFSAETGTGMFLSTNTGVYYGMSLSCAGVDKLKVFSNSSGVGSMDINNGKGNFDFRVRGQVADALIHTDGSSRVGICTESPTANLDVTGDFKVSSDSTLSGYLRLAQSGTAANPSIRFVGDTNQDSGFYLIGQNNLGVSVAGVKAIDLSPNSFTFTQPTASLYITSTDDVQTMLQLQCGSTNTNLINFTKSGGTAVGSISVNNAGTAVLEFGRSAGQTTAFQTNSVERLRIEDSGISLVGGAGSFGSGAKVVFIANATTNPSTNPTGGGVLYCDSGALKYRGSSGTVTTLGPA